MPARFDTSSAASSIAGRPTRSGAWTLVGRCAAGAMAELYFAQPTAALNRHEAPRYVVKILREEFRHDAFVRGRFALEARLGRKLSHPHLVPVLDADPGAETPYMVMPRLNGTTVAERIRAARRTPLAQIWGVARQAAAALAELHELGYLHGDVKPANIVVADDGHATLIDLGSAMPLDAKTTARRRFAGNAGLLRRNNWRGHCEPIIGAICTRSELCCGKC
ncbi:MAG: protein kinase [Pirellulales bacterium]